MSKSLLGVAVAVVAMASAADALARSAPLPRWQTTAPGPERARDACRPPEDILPGSLALALQQLAITIGDHPRRIAGVRLAVTGTVGEDALWSVLGGRPARADAAIAFGLVARLQRLGLHERIVPTIVAGSDLDSAVLHIALVEHPTVRRVVIEGVTEAQPDDLLEALIQTPRADHDQDPCASRPRGEWLARADGQVLAPGIVWGGLKNALTRVLERLPHTGYELGTVQATLSPDGILTVQVDEGRLDSLRIQGVAPRLEASVRERLGLTSGRPFLRADVHEGLRRVAERYPFIVAQRAGRRTPALEVFEAPPAGESRRFLTRERADGPGEAEAHRAPYSIEGRAVTLHLRNRRGFFQVGGQELLRHTPVTGFAPGLALEAQFWDPEDRVHLAAEAQVNVRIGGLRGGGGGTSRRVDWIGGPRLQVPSLRLAEVGFLFMERIDTFDRWRLPPIDSYLWSLLANRPSADYFERRGFAAFATAHLLERLTGGVEYRNERHRSVASLDRLFTLFNRDEPAWANALVDDGKVTSLVVRLEWTSTPVPAHVIGGIVRDTERSLGPCCAASEPPAFRSLATVEVADPGLGGGRFTFVRVVSDSSAWIRTYRRQGVRMRFRTAGRLGGTLPVQLEEALGGWSALRGHDHKELAGGRLSALGTVEYRFRVLSPFADLGAVLVGQRWSRARLGLGVAINLGDDAQVALAWRTDDRARALPEARLLFHRTF